MSTTAGTFGTDQLDPHRPVESEKSIPRSVQQRLIRSEVLNWLNGKSRTFIDASPQAQLCDEACELKLKVEEMFGFKLKQWQIQAMDMIRSGKDIVVVAGTGSGKSIVFQGMCLFREGAVVLVISPLLSLMEDQVFEMG